MLDPLLQTLLLYILSGLLGGVLYAIHYRLFFQEALEAFKRILEGGFAGFILFLLIASGLIPDVPPDLAASPLGYLLSFFFGFWGVEFIEQLTQRFRPKPSGSSNLGIPL